MTSTSFKLFLKSVEPLETISQIPSAKPILGAISTDPLIMCNCESILFLVKNGTWYGCAGRLPRAALSGSRCLMCPEYEYINLDVGSSGTGELSKALPKIERTARLVQESTGLLFRYIPNGRVPLAVPCFWQSSCGASGGQRQAGCGAGRGRPVDFYCMLVCGRRLFSLPELKFLW